MSDCTLQLFFKSLETTPGGQISLLTTHVLTIRNIFFCFCIYSLHYMWALISIRLSMVKIAFGLMCTDLAEVLAGCSHLLTSCSSRKYWTLHSMDTLISKQNMVTSLQTCCVVLRKKPQTQSERCAPSVTYLHHTALSLISSKEP